MDMSELIERTKQNIWQAISDYGKHTDQTSVMDDCTANFVNQLASDSCYAKQELRELFSKSPVWDANLDALVINGTRTHDPDPDRIYALGTDILSEAIYRADNIRPIYDAIRFFYDPNFEQEGIAAIKQLAPKAYAPNKKKSRVFKALCQALGVADETAGSDFQRLYAQFADELTSKKIGFKLYVSINPAHFITMSNPKGDHRGTTLTSCHSFNSTAYGYNNGCTGYARDKVSFIAFTVADPADKETLNNRKTTRQVFAYKPGNGLLLQSRMYNTSGGVYGASEDSKLYRDLIQREISMLENVPNLWKTYPTVGEKSFCVERGDGFGGYPDWEYENFDGKVSIRADHEEDFRSLVVGSYGLCVSCGCARRAAEFIARTARTAAAEITAIAVRNTSMRNCIPSETAAVIGSKSARTAATSITPTAIAAAIIGRTTALRKLTTTITVTVAALSIAAIATNVTIITARTI